MEKIKIPEKIAGMCITATAPNGIQLWELVKFTNNLAASFNRLVDENNELKERVQILERSHRRIS